MLDDFLVRAMAAGLGVAMVAGPLGCFIVWRRMAYLGDTMAHSALLGVALAIVMEIDVMAGVFAVAALTALALAALEKMESAPVDTILGILAHSSLALGLLAAAFAPALRIDLMGFLFGDVLAVSRADIAVIYVGGAVVLAVLALIWRPLLAGTVDADIAEAEAMRPERARIVFKILMAAVIAMAMKVVGVLLMTALLIIPPATARRLAGGPEAMAAAAAGVGCVAVAGGLWGSLAFDTPSGPSIVAAALVLFLAAQAGGGK